LTTHAPKSDISGDLEQLLLEFGDVFNEPRTLPPSRGRHDNRIPVVQGANPIRKQPYRYREKKMIKLIDCERVIG